MTQDKTLIIVKRFECALSYDNRGHNFAIYVGVSGPINPQTGLIMDLRDIKELILHEVIDNYDHTNAEGIFGLSELNDLKPALAKQLFDEISQVLKKEGVLCEFVRVSDMVGDSLTLNRNGEYHFQPVLRHKIGHPQPNLVDKISLDLVTKDPRKIDCFNTDLEGLNHHLNAINMTQKNEASFPLTLLKNCSDFMDENNAIYQGVSLSFSDWVLSRFNHELRLKKTLVFSATHALYQEKLNEKENQKLYGVCSREHGHQFVCEVTIKFDEKGYEKACQDLSQKCIELEARFHAKNLRVLFSKNPSTIVSCETVLLEIHQDIVEMFKEQLIEVNLQETYNNFFIMKTVDVKSEEER